MKTSPSAGRANPGAATPSATGANAAEGMSARKTALYAAIVAAVLGLDTVIKAVVERRMRLYDPIPVLGDFFRLTFLYNPGAAFGINVGGYSRLFFSIVAIVAAGVLLHMYRATPWTDRLRLIALAVVTGGALGNVVDRVRSPRGVVDYLDVGIGAARWPVFNFADVAVTCGAVLLAISLWREEQQRERQATHDAYDAAT